MSTKWHLRAMLAAYIIHWHVLFALIASAVVAGTIEAYPDLNPSNPHFQAAIILFVTAFTSYMVYHIHMTNMKIRVVALEQRPTFGQRG